MSVCEVGLSHRLQAGVDPPQEERYIEAYSALPRNKTKNLPEEIGCMRTLREPLSGNFSSFISSFICQSLFQKTATYVEGLALPKTMAVLA